jgi:hypothetical protein
MPLRYKLCLGALYAFVFLAICTLTLGKRICAWLWATYGGWSVPIAMAVFGVVLWASIALINRIHRDWPILTLPPARDRIGDFGLSEVDCARPVIVEQHLAGARSGPPAAADARASLGRLAVRERGR